MWGQSRRHGMMGSDARSDGELVRDAGMGDDTAFEALYYRYRDWVVRLGRRFTGNEDDALDVLQETFSYVLSKLPGLRLTARMTTFLYPVVRNLSLNVRRRSLNVRRRRERAAGGGISESEIAAPTAVGLDTVRAELARVLGSLPEGQLEAVLMRYVDDMTLEEIAEALGVPVGTVKSRVSNALARLREDPRTRRYFLE